jgi:uncharacterized protein
MRRLMGSVLALVLLASTGGTVFAATPLKIVVYGGTGNIGQRIVHEALERGHDVTVVVRHPAGLTPGPHLHVIEGDVLDRDQVARTVAGSDVVISAVSFRQPPDPAAYRRAAELFVSVLGVMGPHAPRLIWVGGAGSLRDASGALVLERIPPAHRGEVQGQKDALDYLRASGDPIRWTYFSPAGTIAKGTRTGQFRLGDDQLITDAQGNSRISMEDYAVAVIDEAEKPAHIHRRFTIGY